MSPTSARGRPPSVSRTPRLLALRATVSPTVRRRRGGVRTLARYRSRASEGRVARRVHPLGRVPARPFSCAGRRRSRRRRGRDRAPFGAERGRQVDVAPAARRPPPTPLGHGDGARARPRPRPSRRASRDLPRRAPDLLLRRPDHAREPPFRGPRLRTTRRRGRRRGRTARADAGRQGRVPPAVRGSATAARARRRARALAPREVRIVAGRVVPALLRAAPEPPRDAEALG